VSSDGISQQHHGFVEIHGPIVCQPAIFTAGDDDSVGEGSMAFGQAIRGSSEAATMRFLMPGIPKKFTVGVMRRRPCNFTGRRTARESAEAVSPGAGAWTISPRN
jgi:hypothetical protein